MIPLDESELNELARYNSEVARGLVHTEEWRARMARQQARFDATIGMLNEAGRRLAPLAEALQRFAFIGRRP